MSEENIVDVVSVSTEVVKEEVSITKFQQFNNVQEQLKYAEMLIQSGLVSHLKKPEQVVTIANLGRALGVSFEVAVQSINNIQGKPALSVHLMTALAKKAGVDWELIRDAEKVYDEDGKAKDIITTIKFYRYNDKIKRTIENTISYSWSDATLAGYNTKDNWKTKTRNMLRARCLTEGIRLVAPDVLMGVFYEQGEMLDATNQTFDVDDEGNVIIK